MEPEIAQAIVIAITAVGGIVWMAALATLLKVRREQAESSKLASERFEIDDSPALGVIVGQAEVAGNPDDLSTRLASQLAREGTSSLGPVKILTCNRSEVSFVPAGNSPLGFRRVQVRLTGLGSTTRIEYSVETSPGAWLMLGWITLGMGLIALIVVPTLEFAFVLSSPNPQLRFQSIQTVQMVHFLWPPFLFAYRARQPARMLQARMDSLLHNLPFS